MPRDPDAFGREEIALRIFCAWMADNNGPSEYGVPLADGSWKGIAKREKGRSRELIEAAFGWADAWIEERDRKMETPNA